MKKNKLYIVLPILILAILFIATITCTDESPDKKEKWKKEVEQSNKDIKKESTVEDEKGSKQPEDVEDLDEQNKSIPVTLKGYVVVRNTMEEGMQPIFITIDKSKNKVEGETTLDWEEEIEVSGEGGENHHSHRYICRIKLKGTILGTIKKIDENKYYIDATIGGFLISNYGFDPKSTEYSKEVCDFCKAKFDGKPSDFTITGRYWDNTNKASGEVVPKEWYWSVTK